jgi:hypothetical protein
VLRLELDAKIGTVGLQVSQDEIRGLKWDVIVM